MTRHDHSRRDAREDAAGTRRAMRQRSSERFLRTRARARRRRLAASLLAAVILIALLVTVAGKGPAPHQAPGRFSGAGAAGQAISAAHRPAPGRSAPGGTRASERAGSPLDGKLSPGESGAEAIESPQIRSLIALGKPIYCAGNKGNEVALTFDDGPGTYTKLAIAKLHKHGIKATFFIVGRNIPLLPGAIREERALGAVGDHTFTHPLLTALPSALAESEIVRTQAAVEAASGGPAFLFRPPYGAHNATIDSIVRDHNMLDILWTVDSRDSLGADYAQIERNVIDGLHPGAIILMHENHGQTIRAMLNIFAAIARKHLRTVSVPRLLTDNPPSDAQVRAGGLGCGVRASAALSGG